MSPKPPPAVTVIATSTASPMAKETDAAAKVPIDFPSTELIGACIPTRPPATTVAVTARTVLSTLFRLKPVPPDSDVHAQRRIEVERSRHLAADYVAGALGLVLGSLEEELVVNLEDELGRQARLAQRVAAAGHRDLDDVRRRALDDHVHGEALAQHPRLPLPRPQLRDAADATEERGHVAVRLGPLDRLLDPRLDRREALEVAIDELLRLVLLNGEPVRQPEGRQPVDDPVVDHLRLGARAGVDLLPLRPQDPGGGGGVHVLPAPEDLLERLLAGHVGEDPQLHLRVVRGDEHV